MCFYQNKLPAPAATKYIPEALNRVCSRLSRCWPVPVVASSAKSSVPNIDWQNRVLARVRRSKDSLLTVGRGAEDSGHNDAAEGRNWEGHIKAVDKFVSKL